MTWRDKLEIGLAEDAPFRKDNLPEGEVHGPEIPNGPGRSPEIPMARGDQGEVIEVEPAETAAEAAATAEGMPPPGPDTIAVPARPRRLAPR